MFSKLTVLLFLGISFQASANEILKRCQITTDKPALLQDQNKEVICDEVFKSLFDREIKNYDYFIRIEANGFQRTYSVELNKIEGFIGNDRVSNTSGVLYWNPDGSKVVLD